MVITQYICFQHYPFTHLPDRARPQVLQLPQVPRNSPATVELREDEFPGGNSAILDSQMATFSKVYFIPLLFPLCRARDSGFESPPPSLPFLSFLLPFEMYWKQIINYTVKWRPLILLTFDCFRIVTICSSLQIHISFWAGVTVSQGERGR